MRGPRALTAAIATFVASSRFSNYTVRAGDHKSRKDIKIRTVEIKIRVFLKSFLPATMASDSGSHG